MLSHENVKIVIITNDESMHTYYASFFTFRKKKRKKRRKKTPTKTVHKSMLHPASAKIHETNEKKTKTKKARERENKKKGEDRDGRNDEFKFR
jgi:hypothetical protein